jgi:penicillin-binding protein 1B
MRKSGQASRLSVRVQLPRNSFLGALTARQVVKTLILAAACLAFLSVGALAFFYHKYAKLSDEKLLAGPFPNTALLYAAPVQVGIGDQGSPTEIAAMLRESGYEEDARQNRLGWFHQRPDAIEIFPGPDSYFEAEPGVIRFAKGQVEGIISLHDNGARTEYDLEPRMLSSLFDKNREKRRLVKFADIPPILVNAVVSIEDKRFFQHSGFDPIRIVKAVWVDLRAMRNAQGASTLTQQLAKMFWLDSRKTVGRKLAEMLITAHLEQKLTKQQIFEYYANEVDLGRRGSFEIRGFGEASQAYFGKDIRQLTLAEAATLAGLGQQPSARNPIRWPDRAKARRNVVLGMMKDNGYITPSQYDAAVAAPLAIARTGIESTDAPYFVDMINDQLADQFAKGNFEDNGYRVYTTLDLDLQRDAAEAIVEGMKDVDAIIARRNKKDGSNEEPQVAILCADPHTGEVKAMIGGRNYGISQLNHAVAKRPSGSVFKPFVYAAALNTGLEGSATPLTASTIFQDEPRTFLFDGKPYEPANYHNQWNGQVTLRDALAHSLNVPTVEVAEATGYGVVADLAHRAGLNEDIKATPAMALGAYDVTPMEILGAYSVFANKGVWVKPRMIDRVRDNTGNDIWENAIEQKPVLDPRVTYLMVNMLEEVLRTGTGAGVRARGFTLPAAGKTGTSHDAWFAGFTSKLLCIVWIGLDDYKDLKVEGAKAALPVWTEFMKRAHRHRAYRDVTNFTAPDGVVSVQIDPLSGELATGACPSARNEYYLVGTQPSQFCHLHRGGTQFAGWEQPVAPVPGNTASGVAASARTNPVNLTAARQPVTPAQDPPPAPPPDDKKKKKQGLFDRLKSIFR